MVVPIKTQQVLQSLIQSVTYPIDLLLTGKIEEFTGEQQQALESIRMVLQRIMQLVMGERSLKTRAKLNNR